MEENNSETEALVWSSSLDKELRRGTVVQARELSAGRHDITPQDDALERLL
jgi:hypothetical protein